MRIAELDYELPEERIAQHPASERDASRLMVLRREGEQAPEHARFRDIGRWLTPGDLLVINDTRVLPARLVGTKETRGRIELLLVEREKPEIAPGAGEPGEVWLCLAGFSSPPRTGSDLDFGPSLRARYLGPATPAMHRVRLAPAGGAGSVREALERAGRTPLPPYIHRNGLPSGARPGSAARAAAPVRSESSAAATAERAATGAATDTVALPAGAAAGAAAADDREDRIRYQTVYAAHEGAIAAPTAGLHFTARLLEALEARGIATTRLTLHVGPGTFLPVRTETLEDHPMAGERYVVPPAAVEAVARAREHGGRVVAVGTTVVRALESVSDGRRGIVTAASRTDLFILPGHRFRVVDALVTNFHLPRSTLLALVAAFAGRDRILAAYRSAIAAGYRFYSYGDAMLIL